MNNPYERYGYNPNPHHQPPPPNPGDYFPPLLPSPLPQRMHKLAYPGESHAQNQHSDSENCPCEICEAARGIPNMTPAERAQQRELAAQSPYYWRNWESNTSPEHAPNCACEDCHGKCRVGPRRCGRCAFKASFVLPNGNGNANGVQQAQAPPAPVPNRYNLRPRRS